jgi:hypothetical protein
VNKVSQDPPSHNILLVRVASGITSIPLSGDSRLDALLWRFAERSGSLVLEQEGPA